MASASPFAAPPTIAGYADSSPSPSSATGPRATDREGPGGGLQTALEARFAAGSGVDVDAEMAGMVTLQNAYAANAKVIGTLQAMWDALLAAEP